MLKLLGLAVSFFGELFYSKKEEGKFFSRYFNWKKTVGVLLAAAVSVYAIYSTFRLHTVSTTNAKLRKEKVELSKEISKKDSEIEIHKQTFIELNAEYRAYKSICQLPGQVRLPDTETIAKQSLKEHIKNN